jgi:hypothetical protein
MAGASVLLADTTLASPYRVHGTNWPRIPGRFYIRQSDSAVVEKDGATSGPVPAITSATPPSAQPPLSPDFTAGTRLETVESFGVK